MAAKHSIYRILVDLVGSKLCQLISESYSSQDRNTMYIVYVHSGILGILWILGEIQEKIDFAIFQDFFRNLGVKKYCSHVGVKNQIVGHYDYNTPRLAEGLKVPRVELDSSHHRK